jgi:MYXO-CTERM domain-containing protein
MSFYLFVLSTAFAWEVSTNNLGKEMRWLEAPVKFVINTDGKHDLEPSDIEQAVQDAASVWDCTKYGGYLYFDYDGTTKITEVNANDDAHAISFVDTWVEHPELLALTYVFSNENGDIMHFDMQINSHFYTWTLDGANGTHDLQNMFAHEFGHALGLGHSEEIEATMAPTAPPGETSKRDLHNDDIQGFVYLYGGEAPASDEEGPPQLGCSSVPSQNTSSDTTNENNSAAGNNSSAAIGGGGPSGPSSTGGAFVPIENSGCSAVGNSHVGFFLSGLALLGLRRRQRND